MTWRKGSSSLNRRSLFGVFFALGAGLVATALAPTAVPGSLSREARAAGLDELVTAARNPEAIFGSVEVSSSSFKALPQWARVLQSMQSELPAYRSCLRNGADCQTAGQKSWREIISAANGLDRREKLRMVNNFFNTWPYRYDQELYGVTEYWASLTEFLRRSGDCEDYSIAKYYALKELGFTSDEMRIIILLDEIRNIGHAVLAVYIDDEILILDSLSNLVLPHSMYKHYVPQYSMNETRRWAHITG